MNSNSMFNIGDDFGEKKTVPVMSPDANAAREIFRKLGFQLEITKDTYTKDGKEYLETFNTILNTVPERLMVAWNESWSLDECMRLFLEWLSWRVEFTKDNHPGELDVLREASLPKADTLKEFIMKMNLRGY